MGGAAASANGEMAMMPMMMDKMMGMMDKMMGNMGGGAMPAAPMAGSPPGAGSMGGAAASANGEMAMMPMMMNKMIGMMDKMMGNMGGGAMPAAAPMAGSAPGAGAMGGASAPANGEMVMMAMMMDKMMGMMDKKMGGMGGGAMPSAAPMAGSAPGTGAMSMGGAASPPSGEMAMMAMMMDKMMGMMSKEMGGMPAPTPMPGAAPSAGMGMMDDSMEMAGMMGKMRGAGGSALSKPSALPGFSGASHLYHIGSSGFFLDHPQHIDLSVEQRTSLNQIKERSELDQASASRREQEAEQDMWLLTSADQPDNALIEAKLAMIQQMKGDARLQFINAIGSAVKILTDRQRSILTGYSPPTPAAMPNAAAPPMAGAMKDM